MSLDRFVGLSYVDRGRSFDGVDCYGLLRLVYSEMLGIELPSYHDQYATSADRKALGSLIAGELDPWTEVAAGDERGLDAVLMRSGRDVMHIGLVAQPGRLLHIEEGATSRIEPYRSGKLRHRVIGFYRYTGNE